MVDVAVEEGSEFERVCNVLKLFGFVDAREEFTGCSFELFWDALDLLGFVCYCYFSSGTFFKEVLCFGSFEVGDEVFFIHCCFLATEVRGEVACEDVDGGALAQAVFSDDADDFAEERCGE